MADFQSKFSGVEVETALRRLLNFANAGCTTAFNNLSSEEWSTYDNITISSVTYAAIWQIAPTPYNQVFGYGLDKTTGRLVQLYNDHGTYTVSDVGSDTLNTAGSSNLNSKLYLIGAQTQTPSGAQTFSNSSVYTQNGLLYSNSSKVLNESDNASPSGHFSFQHNYTNFNGYLEIYDDGNPSEDADRPENKLGENFQSDPDLYVYATGFTIRGYDDNNDNNELRKLSFPARDGTLGLEIDIVDLTEIH